MERVLRNKTFLKFLNISNKKLKKHIISCASKDQIYSLCDCVFNILNGNIPLNKDHELLLYKKRNCLRILLRKSSVKKKKKILQTGGFLGILVPAIISGLSSIISAFISKPDNEKL